MVNCDIICSQVQGGSGLAACIKCRTQNQENFIVKKETSNINYMIYLMIFFLFVCLCIRIAIRN